jgi:hypothetical protein
MDSCVVPVCSNDLPSKKRMGRASAVSEIIMTKMAGVTAEKTLGSLRCFQCTPQLREMKELRNLYLKWARIPVAASSPVSLVQPGTGATLMVSVTHCQGAVRPGKCRETCQGQEHQPATRYRPRDDQ